MGIDSDQLQALVGVIESGTFNEAARKIHLTQPAISERIRLLEDYLGVPLLIRKTPVVPTEAGRKLFAYAQQVSILESALLESLSLRHPNKRRPPLLPIAVNFDSLSTWFIQVLNQCNKDHSLLEIVSADQTRTIDLLRDGRVLACVTSEESEVVGCKSKALGAMRYICVCTPRLYKKVFSRKENVNAWADTPAVIYGRDDNLHNELLRGIFPKKHVEPHYVYVPHIIAMKEMVLEGQAYALLPEIFIEQELKQNKLVAVAPRAFLDVRLFWHQVSISTPVLQSLEKIVEGAALAFLKKPSIRPHRLD